MTNLEEPSPTPATVSHLPHLAEALDDDRFRHFLDHVTSAVGVAEFGDEEHLIYGNIEFERLTGLSGEDLQGEPWYVLPTAVPLANGPELADALLQNEEYLGAFAIAIGADNHAVGAWSNTIVDDVGKPLRLLAMSARSGTNDIAAMTEALAEKTLC